MGPWSDESVIAPPLRRRTRVLLLVIGAAAVSAFGLGAQHAAHDIGRASTCRYDEAREGVPGLEKAGASVGDRVTDDWKPTTNGVEVRRVASDERHGTVVDASWCIAQDRDHLVVVIDR